MSNDYLPYAIAEAYCLVFAAIMFFRLGSNLGSEHEVKQLRNLIFAYFGMLLTDIFWALVQCGILQVDPLVNMADNALVLMFVSLGCYFWYRYVEDRLHPALSIKKAYRTLINLPLAIVCTLDVISIFTGWLFYIDAEGKFYNADLFIIQSIINYSYLLVPTVNAALRAVKTHSKQQRSEYIIYSVYMIAPLIASELEDVLPTVPVLALNIFMMILLLFLMIQNNRISSDALTGLNNRRRLDQYLENRLEDASPEHPTALFIMDLDRFKTINDTFGHIEGDKALNTFASALKQAAERYKAFIARYGGDEFCLVADSSTHTPEEIERGIRELLDHVQAAASPAKRYRLSVSIGYAICDKPETDVDSFINRADANLYLNKQESRRSDGRNA